MRILPLFVLALMFPFFCAAQQEGPALGSCPSDEQTIRGVERERWQASTRRDIAATDGLLAKDFLYSDDTATVMSKNQFLEYLQKPRATHNDVEPAENARIVINGDIALMNFILRWKVTQSGVSWIQTSRFTDVFVCREGRWKILAMHETIVPNPTRAPLQPADTTLDEFVGKYVISQQGGKLEIKVTRQGHSLFEQWGEDKADEILPGTHDTFFSRADSWAERFLRSTEGKVTGILYTLSDGELEADRIN